MFSGNNSFGNKMMLGAGASALGSGIGSLFGTSNPSNAAMPYLNQAQSQMGQYYNPYIQAGQQSLGQSQQQYGNLVNNPTGMMNQIGSQYHQSPGYQWQLDQGEQATNNAAAAGGMAGSPEHQQFAATIANGLANQDYYNYMGMGLGQYGMGLEGLNSLNQLGYQGANDYATNVAQMLANQAQLAYSGQINQNQSEGGGIGSILGGLGTIASFW